jgi:hypothetical protein
MASDNKKEEFDNIYKKFKQRFSGALEEDGDPLKNLTLLSSEINRAYKNAVFPIKREEIIKADKKGKFIPPCTRNVFLKYYTDKSEPVPLIWSDDDADKYFEDIEGVLTYYITYKEETKNG